MNIFKNIRFSNLLDQFKRLKQSLSEWIVAIDTKQYELIKQNQELHFKLSELESEIKQLRYQNGR
jgi:peptidoglycan hydrolase CwlO-like protein